MIDGFFSKIAAEIEALPLPEPIKQGLALFYQSYQRIILTLPEKDQIVSLKMALIAYPKLILKEFLEPFLFSHYHAKERQPFDFFQFGLDMVRPLVDETQECVLGIEHIQAIDTATRRGENTILFSNHQAEIDPQIISLLLSSHSKHISEDLICVAGHRVTQDPLAIPFSRGRNLICIYSKKYIDHPPEKRAEKLNHNARALGEIEELLRQGGAVIYIAPSGGRDRFSAGGESVIPASFDPQSIEIFRLLSKKAKKTTNFRLLALHTIEQLPPPKGNNIQLGEERIAKRAPAGISVGKLIDMDHIDIEIELATQGDVSTKQEKRARRASLLDRELQSMYRILCQEIGK
ncbi:MAG: 1-acyl-sn-glycerol-3-phosphate acyltransferase [Chlamydia sp.]